MATTELEGGALGSTAATASPDFYVGPEYDSSLYNEDLAPLVKQKWTWYNVFAFWMSDVHSVGGYVTAGSLFAFGLASWQVFVCLIVGIVIVMLLANLVAKPSQTAGAPFPVVSRAPFGVRGANVPAVLRGLIAVAWYGIQTYLASDAIVVVAVKLWPALAPYSHVEQHGFVGLSTVGWGAFILLWIGQAFVFWNGMTAIRKFIDWAGPAVYVVMIALTVYLVYKAGTSNINLNLGSVKYSGWGALGAMGLATSIVVSYFSGPLLNFGDISRYGRTMKDVKRGNFWGLPVNFTFFSILTVVCAAATVPVYGKLITDPIETVSRIDNTFAIVLGALTFAIATVGINIVANFISPAFDFSHVAPQKISWRTGGMIAAVGSVLITPWNLYSSAEVIHYTLDVLASFTGPLFGILVTDFFLIRHQHVVVDDLYSMSPKGRYFYKKGVNWKAIYATVIGGVVALAMVLIPVQPFKTIANFSWFIGAGIGALVYYYISRSMRAALLDDKNLTALSHGAGATAGISNAQH
ncbi:MAG: NCS1 family nucleobase:cation symporter-1 [Acidipropionibacterium sp.]|jgi:NCS1 family nucleobase:cation symporter-1|nr:NCS1 family nucleobase:cation symporter-1 [Acidipropionibacterium sp.]